MIDKNFIKEKIDLITRDLERLKIFADFTFGQVAGDFVKYAALKNFLMEIIGRAIDINEHLIAELVDTKMGTPKNYRETFLFLKDLKVLPEDFAKEIAESAGFRNAIVHEYNNLNQNRVYATVGEAIKQYTKYCDYILKFLEKN